MPQTEHAQMSAAPASSGGSRVCDYCHQPILPSYYYCPNCGAKIVSAPLSTSLSTQAWIYALSIVLPMILFLFVSKWPGWRYYKSNDPRARTVGFNAVALLTLSTIVTIWLAYVWTQAAIQSSVASINADLSGY